MAKNIIVCSDGTGNSANKGRGTNVFKIFESVDTNGPFTNPEVADQIAIYDDGVGTEKWKPLKLIGGMVGWGLSRNVRELYANLARVYEPGDRIYLFGFSRGAFTVRTLADFIVNRGLPKPDECDNDADFIKQVKRAYRKYRSKYWSLLGGLFAIFRMILGLDKVDEGKFQKEVEIHFIGVWDTVDAVGFPVPFVAKFFNLIYKYKFNNPALNKNVKKACHALSIDDERLTFSPTLWDEAVNENNRIEQVWFPGVHSNVGGGYPKQGMSLVALNWMMIRAEAAGLQFLAHDQSLYHNHRNVNDKLYNSRAGFAVYYRYWPRNIDQICRDHHMARKIHVSALARVTQSTEGYAPGNLPADLEIVETLQSENNYDDLQKKIREAHNGDESLLKRHGFLNCLRATAYYGFLFFSLWALAGYVSIQAGKADPGSLDGLKAMGAALFNLLFLDGLGKLWGYLWGHIWILLGMVVSMGIGLGVHIKMCKIHNSPKWEKMQLKKYYDLKWWRDIAYYGFLILFLWSVWRYVCIEAGEPTWDSICSALVAIFSALIHLPTLEGFGKLCGFLWGNWWVLAGLVVSIVVGLAMRGWMHKVFSEFWYSLLKELREEQKKASR